jgi:hypothetical protein
MAVDRASNGFLEAFQREIAETQTKYARFLAEPGSRSKLHVVFQQPRPEASHSGRIENLRLGVSAPALLGATRSVGRCGGQRFAYHRAGNDRVDLGGDEPLPEIPVGYGQPADRRPDEPWDFEIDASVSTRGPRPAALGGTGSLP